MVRRHNEIAEDRRGESWQMTYCSTIAILVAVFLMVLSYSNFEGKKVKGFVGRVEGKRLPGYATSGEGGPANPAEIKIEAAMDDVRRAIALRGKGDQYTMVRTKKGFKVTFPADALFDAGTLKIRDDARPLLDDLASAVADPPFFLGIVSHVARATATENISRLSWEVTAARAGVVMRHLSERGGVPLKRLAAAGFSHHSRAAAVSQEISGRDERVELCFELL